MMRTKFISSLKRLLVIWTVLSLQLFGYLFSAIQEVSANSTSEHFHTSLTSTYTVDTEGDTRVEHAFRIRNLTPEYYINRYSMSLGTEAIRDINVTSGQQPIEANIQRGNNGTSIEIEFADQVLGKDKVREFRVSYLNPVMSEINGQILETFIPAMSGEQMYDEHQVILITPLQFGHPSRIKPEGYSIRQDGQTFVLSYNNLGNEGVSAIFGSQQIFNLSIRYHLQNPNNQPAITQVSLPPDTPYQNVAYTLLDPKPRQIESDADGNWIATYYLPANETVEVQIEASAQISLEEVNPHLNISPLNDHLSSQPYWEIGNQEIIQTASQNQDSYSIYKFVVDTLNYTQEDLTQKLERLGAVEALRNPDLATCQEFTDLFIALARVNNIPARRATGYAHSNDPILQPLSLVTDVLHAWPEYYNQENNSWTPIDPTWGSTMKGVDYFHQFDLKHIVFAYNGRSSRLPLAAGNYKLPNQESKDLAIEFGEKFPNTEASFEIVLEPKKILGFIKMPSWYELVLINTTGSAWYNNQLRIHSKNNQVESYPSEQTLTLLPWETKNVSLQVFNGNNLLPQEDEIVVELTNKDSVAQKKFSIKTIKPVTNNISEFITQLTRDDHQQQSLFPINLSQEQAYLLLGIFAFVFTVTTGGILVFGRRRQSLVRRESEESQEESH